MCTKPTAPYAGPRRMFEQAIRERSSALKLVGNGVETPVSPSLGDDLVSCRGGTRRCAAHRICRLVTAQARSGAATERRSPLLPRLLFHLKRPMQRVELPNTECCKADRSRLA